MNIAQRVSQSLIFLCLISLGGMAWGQAEDEAAPEVSKTEEPSVVPSKESSLSKSAATKTFNKALYFDQVENGVVLPPMDLEYDLSAQAGQELKLGNVTLNEKSFNFVLIPLGKGHPKLGQILGDEANQVTLLMKWPEALFKSGKVEMISHTGEVLWTHSFTQQDRAEWQEKLTEWRKQIQKNGSEKGNGATRAGIFDYQLGLIDVKKYNAPFWNQKGSFRFCLTQEERRNSTKICSQRYGTQSTNSSVVMRKVRAEAPTPRILLNNEEAPLKNTVPVSAEAPTSFFAELASGESYEFIAVPQKLQLMDIADSEKPNTLTIVAFDVRPIGYSKVLNPDQYGYLTRLLGFESTIGDTRKFWMTTIQTDNPHVYMPGLGGGIFKQRFELSEIPRAQSRVYLHKDTPTGTYIDGILLEGRKQASSKVSSDQNSVVEDQKDPSLFDWNFRATERGKINRSYLNVEYNGKTYRSYYEIYKGYPREFSTRLIGVATGSDFVTMGEVAYNQWFEDLFGWTNYWVSRQRWGISANYFQSFNKLTVSTAGDTASLDVLTFALKYRGTPGLWGRDETVGGILAYQSVTLDNVKAPMVGAGVFWARSMPRVFDELFNVIPFLRYPKWVDMEFLYYTSSLDSNVTLNSPLALNFHGKVLWTERFFGEAGFGMKRYGFSNKELNKKAELNTFYGTLGVGVNF